MNYLRLSLIITGVTMAFFATPTPPIQAQQLCGEGRITGTVRYSPASLPLADLGDITFELKGPHGFSETKVGKPRELKIDFSHLVTGTYTYKASGVIEKDPVSFGPLTLTVDGDETVNIILEQKGGGHLQGSFLPQLQHHITESLSYFVPTAQAADLPCAKLEGTVTNKRGEPVANVEVIEITATGDRRPIATTDNQGNYSNAQLQARKYTLTTNKSDFVAQQSDITLKALPTKNTQNFQLNRLIPVKLIARLPGGFLPDIDLVGLPVKVFDPKQKDPIAQLTTDATIKLEQGKTYRFLSAKTAKLSPTANSETELYTITNNEQAEEITTIADDQDIIFTAELTGRAVIVNVQTKDKGRMTDATVTLTLNNGKVLTRKIQSGKYVIFKKELDETTDGPYTVSASAPSPYAPDGPTSDTGQLPKSQWHFFFFARPCFERTIEDIPFTFCSDEAEELGKQQPTHPGLTYIVQSIHEARQKERNAQDLVCSVKIEGKTFPHGGLHDGRVKCGGRVSQLVFGSEGVKEMAVPGSYYQSAVWHELGHAIDFDRGYDAYGDPGGYASQVGSSDRSLDYSKLFEKNRDDARYDMINQLWGSAYYPKVSTTRLPVKETYWRSNTLESFAEQYLVNHFEDSTLLTRVTQARKLERGDLFHAFYQAFKMIHEGTY